MLESIQRIIFDFHFLAHFNTFLNIFLDYLYRCNGFHLNFSNFFALGREFLICFEMSHLSCFAAWAIYVMKSKADCLKYSLKQYVSVCAYLQKVITIHLILVKLFSPIWNKRIDSGLNEKLKKHFWCFEECNIRSNKILHLINNILIVLT